jgi:flotillin
MLYHTAEPNSYLAITGAGIPSVKICKKGFVYPLQKVTKISITPFDFSMSLQAMTSEKLYVHHVSSSLSVLTRA